VWVEERQQGLLFEPTLEKQDHRHRQAPEGTQTNTGLLVDAASAALLHHSRTIAKALLVLSETTRRRKIAQSHACQWSSR